MASNKSVPEGIQIGQPLTDFATAVDVIKEMQAAGKCQVFVAVQSSVKFISDGEQLLLRVMEKLGYSEKKRSEMLLEEVQTFLQVLLGVEGEEVAKRFLERSVFEKEFKKAEEDEKTVISLRETISKKLEIIKTNLYSEALRVRTRRLSTIFGPRLRDLDFELVSIRSTSVVDSEIASPFLRIRLRYSVGGRSTFPFLISVSSSDLFLPTEVFELECDETDIDLLVMRLRQAKQLLSRTIEDKIKSSSS